MNVVEQVKRIPTVIWLLLLLIILVVVGTAVGSVVGTSEADAPEPMDLPDVISMLENNGMDIHQVNPRESNFTVTQSADIMFQDVSGRIEGIVNTFLTLDDREAWLGISQGFDGVAVIRDNELWAVSVDSDLSNSRDIGERLARTLQGEVI